MTNSILILGATSAIAQAVARRHAEAGWRVTLVARHAARLASIAADLTARGAAAVATHVVDLVADDPDAALPALLAQGLPARILLAHGLLGDVVEHLADPTSADANIAVNFTSPVRWMLALLRALPTDAACTFIVLGSVAGDRGRASNLLYGATKAGLAAFCDGLRHHLARSAIRILLVKPGPVDTPMTAHMPKGGPIWSTPERVAADIDRALARGAAETYTPGFWRWIMLLIRNLPRFLLHRTKL